MPEKLYAGCTLGPIFQVMQKARRNLEMWTASYIFSYIAQHITQKLREQGALLYSPNDWPDGQGARIGAGLKGAGLYSDRIFFSIECGEDDARVLLSAALDSALAELADDMAFVSEESIFDKAACIAYLKQNIYLLTCFETAHTLPMHSMNATLDRMEKYAPFADEESGDDDYFLGYLDAEKLRRSAFVDQHLQGVSFDLEKLLSSGGSDGMLHMNYMALVQADGDRMGKLLGILGEKGDEDGIRSISAELLRLGETNTEMVKAYGGLPIYFGGDDMLFLAPLYGCAAENGADGRKASLFDLLAEMNETFQRRFAELMVDTCGIMPSLSFGVAISYRKYPLQLVRKMAYEALMFKAKKTKWSGGREKGAALIVLRRHSGQTSEVPLSLWKGEGEEKSLYDHFRALANAQISNVTLRAMHWKLSEQFDVVWYLMSKLAGHPRIIRLTAWFDGNFNEWLEADRKASREEKDAKIREIVDFLCAIADACEGNRDTAYAIMDGTFRIDEFLHSPRKAGG